MCGTSAAVATTPIHGAVDTAGERLGSTTRTIAAGETLFLVDVLARLGAGGISEGQIRVTKTGGGGILWGLLSTVSDDGRVSVAVGRYP